MDLLQLIGVNINNITQNPIVALLISGAVEGIFVGLVAGALILPISREPDAFGRALLLAIILGAVGFSAEFIRIGAVMGVSMGEMIEALNVNSAIGPMVWAALARTGLYMLLGAVIGAGSVVPQFMLRGMVVGIFLGAIIGAVLWMVTNYYFGFAFHIMLFRLLIVLGIWGLITAIFSA